MSSSDLTASEMYQSLNGFDEIAIATHFGAKVQTLGEQDLSSFARALVFVDKRRQGLKDKEAFTAAMELRISEVQDYFVEDNDELDPEDPETEQGKEPAH